MKRMHACLLAVCILAVSVPLCASAEKAPLRLMTAAGNYTGYKVSGTALTIKEATITVTNHVADTDAIKAEATLSILSGAVISLF